MELGNPPLLPEKCPNINRTKKFLKKIGFGHDPPLLRKTKQKLIFFRMASLRYLPKIWHRKILGQYQKAQVWIHGYSFRFGNSSGSRVKSCDICSKISQVFNQFFFRNFFWEKSVHISKCFYWDMEFWSQKIESKFIFIRFKPSTERKF